MTTNSDPSPLRAVLSVLGPYGAALFVQRSAGLVLIPLLTWALRPAELGTFAVLTTLAYFAFMTLVDLGLGTAAFRLAADEERDPREVFATCLRVRLLIAALCVAIVCVARSGLSRLIAGDDSAALAVCLAATSIFLRAATQTMTDYLRHERRDTAVAWFVASLGLLETCFALGFVLLLGWGYTGWVLALVAAQVLAGVPLAWRCRSLFAAAPGAARVLLALGLPLGVMQSLYALRELDRFLVGALDSLAEAGRYDIAVKIAAPLAALNTVLILALEQRALGARDHAALLDRAAAFLRVYLTTTGLCGLFTATLAPELLLLVAPEYRAAAPAAALLLFLPTVEGVRRVAGLGMDLTKRTRGWFLVSTINGVVAVGGAVVLIPHFGGLGAAVALLLGAAVGAVTAARMSQRWLPGALSIARVLAPCVFLAGGAAAALRALPEAWLHLPHRAAFALVGGAGLLWLSPAGRKTWSKLVAP